MGAGRAYIAETSTYEMRTTNLAYLTAMQYTGFTVTPLLGAFVAYLTRQAGVTTEHRWLGYSDYTMPAAIVAMSCLMGIGLLQYHFYDPFLFKKIRQNTHNHYEEVC